MRQYERAETTIVPHLWDFFMLKPLPDNPKTFSISEDFVCNTKKFPFPHAGGETTCLRYVLRSSTATE